MRTTTFLLAALSATTSAWKLELFENPDLNGLIYELSGSTDHDCQTLPISAQDRARSYRWDSDGILLDNCAVVMYQDEGCNVRLFSSGEQDNNENLVGASDRNVEGFIVDC